MYTITEKLSKKLKDILTFIVKCYSFTWVLIKQATSLSEAPEIIYKFLTYLKDVDNPDNTAIVHRNLKSNTFTLLTDNFLYSLCLSNESNVREIGLKAILDIRSANRSFETEPMKQIPQINFKANLHWSELIDVSIISNLCEPPATKDLSNESIQDFREPPC